MDFNDSEQLFLEKIEETQVTPFDLEEEEIEIFQELHDRGVVEANMNGVIYQVDDSDEDSVNQETQRRSMAYTQNDRVEARKKAADSLEEIRQLRVDHKYLQSLLENAETSWDYAEQEDSVKDAIKLYQLVDSALTLSNKLINNVEEHNAQFV